MALVAALALHAANSQAGLLANPGFESGAGERVSDWTWFGNAWQSTNHVRSGTYSLKLYGNWSGPWNASGASQTLPARPGQRWTLSGYGLNASDDALAGQNYALMKIVWFGGPNGTGEELQPLPGPGALTGDNPGIESALLTNGTPTDVWQFLSASGVAPPGTMSVQLLGGLFLQPATDTGAVWFDDLKATATPVWGHALSLDGTDDHVNLPDIWFGNVFTLEAWVFVRSHNNWSRVMDLGNGMPMDNIVLALSDGTSGRPAFQAYAGTSWQGITAPDPLPPRQWVHLAATLSNNVAMLYVNGLPVASASNWTPLAGLWRTNNYLGRSAWPWDGYADAVFDDLRIWNVARSAEQIQASLGYPLRGDEPGLVAYAKCNERRSGERPRMDSLHPTTLGQRARVRRSERPCPSRHRPSFELVLHP
ncbi:MAG: LamG domain-containing protein [Verrucomicrobia bacterium]|nr:LamG domain-containing protein [Verrucomicrobiota bacterium]